MSKVVTITAGHSDSDPGAVNGLIREEDIASDARNIVAHYLKQANIQIRTDGEGQGNLPLRTAIQLIKGAAVAVEFHCNAALDKTAGGTEAISPTNLIQISKDLCRAVVDTMGTKVRGGNGGWKDESSGQHSRLGYVHGGGIILELFFISNDEELATWNKKKWLICKSIAEALIKHVGG